VTSPTLGWILKVRQVTVGILGIAGFGALLDDHFDALRLS
jgi:hypothetical protein